MANEVDVSTLQAAIGDRAEVMVLSEGEAAPWTVHGATPRLVCRPANADALAQALGACDQAGAAVIPWGGGSQQRLGAAPARADVILLTQGIDRLVEYEPANLTATAEAGMKLVDFQAALGERGQWLPFDPPLGPEATIGGALAANVNGPRRLKEGGLRDLVIGLRVAYPEGVLARSGGRVVKNVTGYDLNKLHVGALGTLGVIVEVTFKVAPRPESEATWVGIFQKAEHAARAYATLARTALSPSAVEFVNDQVAPGLGLPFGEAPWLMLGRASGFGPAVARHMHEFSEAGSRAGALECDVLLVETAPAAWAKYADLASARRWQADNLTCRLAVPPAQVGVLCDHIAGIGGAPAVWASAGGAIFWSVPAETASAALVTELRQAAERADGKLVVENWPDALAAVDVWGTPGGSLAAMRALKVQYDPHGTLNPGRYVGGI